MRSLIFIIIVILLTTNCESNEGGIDPPFGLKWGISYKDIGKLVEQGKCSIEGFYPNGIDSSVCEYITKASLVGEYLNQLKFADFYFWNDSLFEVSLVLLNRPKAFKPVSIPVPKTDTLYDYNAKVVEITDSLVRLIDKNIKATHNFKKNISKIIIDTSYRESKNHNFPDKIVREETVTYFGYNNTSIVLEIISYEDKSDSTSRSGENEFLCMFFKSDSYQDISKKFKKWKEKTGKDFNWHYHRKGYR